MFDCLAPRRLPPLHAQWHSVGARGSLFPPFPSGEAPQPRSHESRFSCRCHPILIGTLPSPGPGHAALLFSPAAIRFPPTSFGVLQAPTLTAPTPGGTLFLRRRDLNRIEQYDFPTLAPVENLIRLLTVFPFLSPVPSVYEISACVSSWNFFPVSK